MTNHLHAKVTRGNGILEKFLAKKRASIANKFIDPILHPLLGLRLSFGFYHKYHL